MKSFNFAVAITVLVSLLAVSESKATDIEQRLIIDPIIKAILESLRPKFANLTIDDINEVVENPNVNATFIVKNMYIRNLDKFVIKALQSNVIPLKLQNLTLTWSEVTASAYYDFNATFNIPKFSGPLNINGKGDAKISLRDVFFTVGANMEMKNKALQVKPKGLFGFDVVVKSANVTFTSMMGSPEFGQALGVFLSKMIPDLVQTLKTPLFNAFQDDIIRIVNQVLKGQETYFDTPFEDEISNEFLERLFFLNFSNELRED